VLKEGILKDVLYFNIGGCVRSVITCRKSKPSNSAISEICKDRRLLPLVYVHL
jgi:hypothetical protein